MSVSVAYQNAFAEVDEILNHLVEEDYAKIPHDLIETFQECKNPEYEYAYDEDLELSEQPMLPETKAILFNLFRDYLSTPEQKEKIIRMQAEDRKKRQEAKKQEAYSSVPEVKETAPIGETIRKENNLPIEKKETGILGAIKKMIKKILKK